MGHSMMCEDSPLLGSIPQDSLSPLRGRFWDRFLELGLPVPKQEAFQYLPLRKFELPTESAPKNSLTKGDIEAHILPQCRGSLLVFVDGYYEESLSDFSALPSACVRLPLDAAMKTYGLVLQNRLSKELKEETDCFAALNGALHGRGAFIYLPPKTTLSQPLQVLSILSSPDKLMSPRLQIFLGKNAKLDLIQTLLGGGIALDHVDAVLDEGSELRLADHASLDQQAWLFRSLRATVKGGARLTSFSYSEGAASLRQSLRIALAEERANVELKGLSRLLQEREAHTHVLVEHQAPNCCSRQHFKKALFDKSRSSFEGKIFVHPIAQKTEAYQFNQNLLLSDQATAHAKPNLEIFADDVKASHGATFSQLSDEEIFYFQARGISAADAKNLLLAGFCRDLFDSIEIPGAREYFLQKLGL